MTPCFSTDGPEAKATLWPAWSHHGTARRRSWSRSSSSTPGPAGWTLRRIDASPRTDELLNGLWQLQERRVLLLVRKVCRRKTLLSAATRDLSPRHDGETRVVCVSPGFIAPWASGPRVRALLLGRWLPRPHFLHTFAAKTMHDAICREIQELVVP
eukprot:scaffold361_cov248-Pinguiococcus_pyrenoidosus.AAC.19